MPLSPLYCVEVLKVLDVPLSGLLAKLSLLLSFLWQHCEELAVFNCTSSRVLPVCMLLRSAGEEAEMPPR